jgi:hypothetical protein
MAARLAFPSESRPGCHHCGGPHSTTHSSGLPTSHLAPRAALSPHTLSPQDLLGDANPMVVANAVAALAEIQELGGRPVLDLTLGTVSKLLRALNECTEWGQVGRGRRTRGVGASSLG